MSNSQPIYQTHGANAQATVNHHWGAAALGGIALIRHNIMRFIQNIIKSAIITFLETCDTNPRIAVVVATPALLQILYLLAVCIISIIVLVIRTILTIMSDIISVIIRGFTSIFFETLSMMLAAIPTVGFATALLVGANKVSQFIICRMPQNGGHPLVTRPVEETDWKSVMDRLVNFGGKLGPESAVVWEGLSVLRVALYNFLVEVKSGIQDLRKARMERLPKDRSDPLNDFTAETNGERSQGNPDSVHQTQFVPSPQEYAERLQSSGSTEGLKRRSLFPKISEGTADTMSA